MTRAVIEDVVASNGHLPTEDSWSPVDLTPILAGLASGELQGPRPVLEPRSDGVHLLYPGELHSVSGEPEAGKGLWIYAAAARILPHSRVLVIDCEDSPVAVISRLLAFGVTPADIAARLVYVRPEEALRHYTVRTLLARGPYALAIVDGQSEVYSLLGLDPYSNSDIPKFLRAVPRRIAATGAAVVLIDHVVKNKTSRGRFALGGIHKLAGVAVAYGVEAIDPPSRTRAGTLKVTIHKDRHGHVRGHAVGGTIALISVVPEADGDRIAVTVRPPDSVDAAGTFRPTALMERVSRYVESAPGATSRDIRSNVKGTKNDMKTTALEVLIAEGCVSVEEDGRARRHHSLCAYREDRDNVPCARVPDRASVVPGKSESERAHVPHPVGGTGTAHAPAPSGDVPHSQDQLGVRSVPAPWASATAAQATASEEAEFERMTAKYGGTL